MDVDGARTRIQKLLVTGDNRLKQGVSAAKARESYEQALAVAREAGIEESVRPLVEIRLADLERLAGESDRRARMVTELVALPPGGGEIHVRGEISGEIAGARRGRAGFGYDPIFVPAGQERTIAELGEAWKRANSHRARAAQALLAAVRSGAAS